MRDRRSWRGHVYVDTETRWFGETDRFLHFNRPWQHGARVDATQRGQFKRGGRVLLRGLSSGCPLALGRCFRLLLDRRIAAPQPA